METVMHDWKQIDLEYGDRLLTVPVPLQTEILSMRHPPPIADPVAAIEAALEQPIGSSALKELIEKAAGEAEKPVAELTAAVTVSDNTRPVPYSSDREDGILLPLLEALHSAGIPPQNVTIVVGTGTHVATSLQWKKTAFGDKIVERYRILDHDCTSPALKSIGKVDGIEVKVNEQFAKADIRIATSLVEPHLMAGVSGGAKAICPGLISIETTRLFHSAQWMDNPNATNLVLENNPCFEFPRKVAGKVGIHFSVNCLVNREGRLTGIFTGDIEKAHEEAAREVRNTAVIPCRDPYDIIITHGGKVAVNHYQAAKAAYGTIPVIREGGIVILAAYNGDPEPVGKPEYKELLDLLRKKGPGVFSEYIKRPEWEFVPDQWQVQKWDQVFMKLGGFEKLIYCTDNIPADVLSALPCRSGYEFLSGEGVKTAKLPQRRNAETSRQTVQTMVLETVRYAVQQKTDELGREPLVAVLPDGPYGVPLLE